MSRRLNRAARRHLIWCVQERRTALGRIFGVLMAQAEYIATSTEPLTPEAFEAIVSKYGLAFGDGSQS